MPLREDTAYHGTTGSTGGYPLRPVVLYGPYCMRALPLDTGPTIPTIPKGGYCIPGDVVPGGEQMGRTEEPSPCCILPQDHPLGTACLLPLVVVVACEGQVPYCLWRGGRGSLWKVPIPSTSARGRGGVCGPSTVPSPCTGDGAGPAGCLVWCGVGPL